MKIYQKPTMDSLSFSIEETLSSLNDWLSTAGSDFSEAGITTYLINS